MSQGIIACENCGTCDICRSREIGESIHIANIAGGVLRLCRYPGGLAVYLEYHDAGGLRYSEPLRHLFEGARKLGWNGE